MVTHEKKETMNKRKIDDIIILFVPKQACLGCTGFLSSKKIIKSDSTLFSTVNKLRDVILWVLYWNVAVQQENAKVHYQKLKSATLQHHALCYETSTMYLDCLLD